MTSTTDAAARADGPRSAGGDAPGREGVVVDVRFFAGAAEAAGTDSLEVVLPAGARLSGLRAELELRRPALARVLAISSFLLAARPVTPGTDPELVDGLRVDVLPPFAGG